MSGAFTITKDFTFAAAHRLRDLDDDHQCGRIHGHNYVVRVEVSSDTLDSHGFIVDYGELAGFGAWIDDNFDHRNLNDRVSFNPTAEELARYLYGILAVTVNIPGGATFAVSVSETPKTWARFAR